jgi:hypothetical protein
MTAFSFVKRKPVHRLAIEEYQAAIRALKTAQSIKAAIFRRHDLVDPTRMVEESGVFLIIRVQWDEGVKVVNRLWQVRVCLKFSLAAMMDSEMYVEAFAWSRQTFAVALPVACRK